MPATACIPRLLTALLLLQLPLLGACAPNEPEASQNSDRYTYTSRNRDGIGKFYLGREISYVMGHQGARWLERPEREREERTDLALQNLPLQPGDAVADIGAGSGYFSIPMAQLVGATGTVYAVDIQPEMLSRLEKNAAAAGVENIKLIQGAADQTNLPANAIDMALFVDVYHELEWPYEVMESLYASMKPGGRVVLLEYRAEDPTVPILRLHKMTSEQAIKELEAVGFSFVENLDFLPQQHFLVFEKSAESSAAN